MHEWSTSFGGRNRQFGLADAAEGLAQSVNVLEFVHRRPELAAWQRGSLGIYRVCGPVSKVRFGCPPTSPASGVDYPESFDLEMQTAPRIGANREF